MFYLWEFVDFYFTFIILKCFSCFVSFEETWSLISLWINKVIYLSIYNTEDLLFPSGGLQGGWVAHEEHGSPQRQRGHAAAPVHRQVCGRALERRWVSLPSALCSGHFNRTAFKVVKHYSCWGLNKWQIKKRKAPFSLCFLGFVLINLWFSEKEYSVSPLPL